MHTNMIQSPEGHRGIEMDECEREGSDGGFFLVLLAGIVVVVAASIVVVAVVVLVLPGLVVVLVVAGLVTDDVDGGDTVEVGLGDGDVQILKAEAVAAGGDLIHDLHDPTVDGDGIRLDLQVEELAEIGQATAAVDAEGVLGDLLIVLDDLVMLVPDIAYQLLQDILHGDDTQSTAVLVQDDGQVGLVSLEVAEQVVDALALMDEQGGRDDLIQGLIREALGGEDVLGVDDADDLVDAVLVDQQAGL